MELRPEPLPVPADWEAATSRAEVLFGIRANPYLTAAGLAEFTESLRTRLDVVADSATALVPRVELAYRNLGLPADRPGRLATARAGAALVEALRRAGGRVHLVETLARTALPASATAVANSLSRAPAVASAVDAFHWDRLGPLRAAENQDDDRGRGAARALTALREAVGADEFATKLGPALSAADDADLRVALRGPAGRTGAAPAGVPPGRRAHLRAAVAAAPVRPSRAYHPGQGRPGQRGARAAASVPGRAPRRAGGRGMAGAGVTVTATRATLPVLRALLDQARRKNYPSGVLGVRARPEWPGPPEFTHADVPVRVVPCVSALAVREALLGRAAGQWLVVLTDRPDDDLGAGVLSHLRVAPAAHPGPLGCGPAPLRRHRGRTRPDRRGRGPGHRDRPADGVAVRRAGRRPRAAC